METLMPIGIAMTAGLLLSRLVKKLKLPAVTGYLIAGILVGPFCLGMLGDFLGLNWLGYVSEEAVKSCSILCDVALGFIAFAIGDEFRLSSLKKIGKQATVIGIFQALVATVVVDLALIGLYFILPEGTLSIPAALVLGAVATATAPAATLMVVRQYKAKGKLTDILLPVVAIDDAVGLVVFAISFGIAQSIQNGAGLDIFSVVINPLCEVVLSLLLGLVMGLLFSYAEKHFKSNSKRLTLSITFVIMSVALAKLEAHIPVGGSELHIKFSSLLVCMMLGTVFCNMCDFSDEIMGKTDRWTAPLFLLFFVLSGAELNFSVFGNIWVIVIGIVYILTRAAGKILGASSSAKVMKCEPNIVKYLGVTLLPQAGVALGMSLIAAQTLGEVGEMVRNITLFAVLVYELVGPMFTKIALTKAGDITPRTTIILGEQDDE